ncbi:MAG: hypothetical protein V4682_03910 [Patescibacteria group bacterium]
MFVTWGFWALFDLRMIAPYALIAALCIIQFGAGVTMLQQGENGGFGIAVLSWIIYGVVGARLWAKLGGDLEEPFPKALRTLP